MTTQAPVLPEIDSPGPQGAECRVWERHNCGLQTSCQPIAARADKDILWQATLRDVSASGVGMILDRRFEPGAGLAIEVPGLDYGNTLLAKVVHATALPDGKWLLGCTFVSRLGADELQKFMQMGQADQKKQIRKSSPTLDRLVADTGPDSSPTANSLGNPQKVQVIAGVLFRWVEGGDQVQPLAIRRLYLKGTWPTLANSVLHVKLPSSQAGKVRVTNCSRQDGRWVVDYEFVGRPTADLLLAFGIPTELW